jgi:hypothetical protein
VKSCLVSTTERFEPNFEAWARNVSCAPFRSASAVLILPSVWKVSTELEMPRPFELKRTPVMPRLEVESSLKVTVRLSPSSRLMPLKLASMASWSICWRNHSVALVLFYLFLIFGDRAVFD